MTNDQPDRDPLLARASAQAFGNMIRQQFPEVGAQFNDDDGVHFMMGTLADHLMELVHQQDAPGAAEVLTFIESVAHAPSADAELLNAVSISFIEPTLLRRTAFGRNVWGTMPPRIRTLILTNKNRMPGEGE